MINTLTAQTFNIYPLKYELFIWEIVYIKMTESLLKPLRIFLKTQVHGIIIQEKTNFKIPTFKILGTQTQL